MNEPNYHLHVFSDSTTIALCEDRGPFRALLSFPTLHFWTTEGQPGHECIGYSLELQMRDRIVASTSGEACLDLFREWVRALEAWEVGSPRTCVLAGTVIDDIRIALWGEPNEVIDVSIEARGTERNLLRSRQGNAVPTGRRRSLRRRMVHTAGFECNDASKILTAGLQRMISEAEEVMRGAAHS